MEHRNLGNSGLRVPVLCLGTMTFGEPSEGSFMHGVATPEEHAYEIMNASVDAGANFFDTADVYGNDGLTERVIGSWFEKDKRRDEVVLATKFRFRMSEGPMGTGASRYRMVKCVEDSLRRLKTDHIDLYQVHMQDNFTPEEETLRAFDDLVRAGKVLYTGVSNYTAYRLVDSVHKAKGLGVGPYASLQAQYSLLVRDIERELVPACEEHGIGIITWTPLAGGFLAGRYKRGDAPAEGSRLAKWKQRWEGMDNDRSWTVLETVQRIAGELDSTPARVSLAWLLCKPAVTSVIFGARTIEQLRDNLAAAELELSEGQVSALEEASAFDVGYPYDFMKNVMGRW